MVCTILSLMVTVVLLVDALNFSSTQVPSMKRLGCVCGILGLVVVGLLFTGYLHAFWERML